MDNDPKIILQTERLLFRQHLPVDMDAFCAMEMDPEVRRYAGGHPRTRDQSERKFAGELEPIRNNLGLWAIIYKPEGLYVGRCGLYPHFRPDGGTFPGEASLAYYIASGYWGRGLATEAARAFVQFGFDELKLNRIVTTIDVRNKVSVHIVEKLRFELIKTETGPRSFYYFALINTALKSPKI